ncbi:MAG: hypothetical protein ABR878_01065 [Roseiarcus sp.]|jgi:putative copper export protein
METALALRRFAHFLAAMGLFGVSLYVRLLTPPDLARALAPITRSAFSRPGHGSAAFRLSRCV